MSQGNLELVRNTVAQQLNDEKIKLETVEKSFSLLTDFIFQTMSTAKSQETNEARLETVSNGMQEIKKYAEQEIQKHTHALGVLTGKLQGIEIAYQTMTSLDDNDIDEDTDDEVDSDSE